jgi:hypothetical protein
MRHHPTEPGAAMHIGKLAEGIRIADFRRAANKSSQAFWTIPDLEMKRSCSSHPADAGQWYTWWRTFRNEQSGRR